MATVIERLRELKEYARRLLPGGQTTKKISHSATAGEVALERYLHACHLAMPALLALADAVKAKDQAAIDKAMADLEKEAT